MEYTWNTQIFSPVLADYKAVQEDFCIPEDAIIMELERAQSRARKAKWRERHKTELWQKTLDWIDNNPNF